MTYFALSVLVLALLLFFPISKLIWVMSVRRLQRKLNTTLEENEIQGQLNRARFIAVFLAVLFSFLFNLNLLGWPAHG
ncbi:hypothetical protein [Kaarinaea lacus]